ncbi:MAG TPA: SDR family NAD(P)-dependent oxidoreductase [Albitalea sp.]|nr:SDR family NAD(P)-dependent oxidoreductase [Albitalea sp.]
MKDKIVVITGGATGMGLAIAKQLVQGNTVVSIDRTPAKIAALRQALPAVHSLQADLTSSADREHAVAAIEARFGRIDLLINNAGQGGAFDFIGSSEAELKATIASQLAINYEAPVLLTKRALPLLQKSAAPTVVVSSTGLVYTPMAVVGTYCASKAAVHVATMALRHQLARLKIRVVEVLPPSVDTALNTAEGVAKMSPERFATIFLKKLAQGGDVINIGQSAALEKISRLSPRLAFRMLNR